ncbi:hypothetical protein M0813_19852 [Anaeramoeba flamelloides]|uniref:J domain-containing protein n=2 Tax=Anaeramoeba flamelloides TaxID=1746091 RepID=A0AAV8A2W4_9EUKA|nr:hypothetical protein M0812_01110 [Anaeramoeba flamelloides]KAJ3449245.1 hypothetical protein M0812_05390 [Anaeramoeba flamelloides]KAJ6246092.1 hypothetical protein M0813_19852 [Anaeramoeba flamelloides]|eukprot:Anaeramoba_flamelloidesa89220_78.p1 GENE.a89220_78~~a89220_78.p1  ORF type:complete len:124 (-),score=17.56 a89220_78:57-392(-)
MSLGKSPIMMAVGAVGALVGSRILVSTLMEHGPKLLTKAFNSSKYGFDMKMNKTEASKILGVSLNASQDDIKKRHRRLMYLNHPDRGGSPLISTKINEAKELLFGGKSTQN